MKIEYKGTAIEVNAFTQTARIGKKVFRNLDEAKRHIDNELSD